MKRFGLLALLYFVQGLPFGFQSTALPVYLRAEGISLESIGFASALALPWMLKALWAPLVDSRFSARLGRRRSWILPMQAGLMCCIAASMTPRQVVGQLVGARVLGELFAVWILPLMVWRLIY